MRPTPMSGASSWSFREDDSRRIQAILSNFLGESNARTALIVDRTGQMVSTVGEAPVVRRHRVRIADRSRFQRQ